MGSENAVLAEIRGGLVGSAEWLGLNSHPESIKKIFMTKFANLKITQSGYLVC